MSRNHSVLTRNRISSSSSMLEICCYEFYSREVWRVTGSNWSDWSLVNQKKFRRLFDEFWLINQSLVGLLPITYWSKSGDLIKILKCVKETKLCVIEKILKSFVALLFVADALPMLLMQYISLLFGCREPNQR